LQVADVVDQVDGAGESAEDEERRDDAEPVADGMVLVQREEDAGEDETVLHPLPRAQRLDQGDQAGAPRGVLRVFGCVAVEECGRDRPLSTPTHTPKHRRLPAATLPTRPPGRRGAAGAAATNRGFPRTRRRCGASPPRTPPRAPSRA